MDFPSAKTQTCYAVTPPPPHQSVAHILAYLVKSHPVWYVIELLVPKEDGLYAVAQRLHVLTTHGIVVAVSVYHHLAKLVVVYRLEGNSYGHVAVVVVVTAVCDGSLLGVELGELVVSDALFNVWNGRGTSDMHTQTRGRQRKRNS